MLSNLFFYASLTFGALLPVVNPFSTAPVFVTVTKGFSDGHRKQQARSAAIYMTVILLVALFTGAMVLEFFGITLPILRIGGGLVIARVGFSMLDAPADSTDAESELMYVPGTADVAFMPIALPMLAGPGSIALTIAMATERTGLGSYIGMAIGIALVALVAWVILHFSTVVVGFIGKTGMNALTRIMGLLLICIGIQFVVSGTVEGLTGDRMVGVIRELLDALGARQATE